MEKDLNIKASEREIAKGLLYYPKIFKEYMHKIKLNYFSSFPARVVIGSMKQYYHKYEKVPNPVELETFIEQIENKIEFSENKDKRKKEWEAIKAIIYAPQNSQDNILNEEQFKDLLVKFLKVKELKTKAFKLEKCFKTGEGIEETLTEITERIKGIKVEYDGGLTINDVVKMDEEFRRGIVPTGIGPLDTCLGGGLAKKEIGMVASPPGLGKSTMLYNFAYNAMIESKKPVVYISLEIPPEQIVTKILRFFMADVFEKEDEYNLKVIIDEKNLTAEQKEKLNLVKELFRIKHLSPGTSIYEIISFIESLLEREPDFGDGIFIIDYLNEIYVPKINEPWIQLEKITTLLDKLAQESKIPIWTATQGSANAEYKKNFHLKDIYGSKIGITKKISFGLGITKEAIRENESRVWVSFFKNRLFGTVNPQKFVITYDNKTGKIDAIQIEEEDREQEIEIEKKKIGLSKREELALESGKEWVDEKTTEEIAEKLGIDSPGEDEIPF